MHNLMKEQKEIIIETIKSANPTFSSITSKTNSQSYELSATTKDGNSVVVTVEVREPAKQARAPRINPSF